MWLWQQKKHSVTYIRLQLFVCITLLHIMLLSIFFLVCQPKKMYELTISAKNAQSLPVLFVPFNTRIDTQGTHKKSKQSASKQTAVKKHTPAKPITPEKKCTLLEKTVVQPKKATKEKIVTKKTSPRVRQEIKQSEPPAHVAHKAEPIVESPQALPEQAHYVAHNELAQLHMQHYIQQEIGPHFKPPCALAENLSCILKMQISTGGAVDDLDVVQSSGVTLFDLAAEHAVCQLTEFPAWAHGKEFLITFKQ